MKKVYLFCLLLLCIELILCKQGHSYCLKDCQKATDSSMRSLAATTNTPTTIDNSNNIGTRNNSHNMGNVDHSIIGDVSIQNGHTKMEISNVQKGSSIDASIKSTVILGDVHQ